MNTNSEEPPCHKQHRGLEDMGAKTKKNKKMCKSKNKLANFYSVRGGLG